MIHCKRLAKTCLPVIVLLLGNLIEPLTVHAGCGDGTMEAGEDCDDGNIYGGDGCAKNCTTEGLRDFVIDSSRSFAATQLAFARIEFVLNGQLKVTTGGPDENGIVPFVIRQRDITIQQVAVPGLACVCTTSDELSDAGPGNIGFGFVVCGEGQNPEEQEFVIPNVAILAQDHNVIDTDPTCSQGTLEGPEDRHPGACQDRIRFTPEGTAEKGSALLFFNLTLRLISDGGTCTIDPADPAKGVDGIPCTSDDPVGLPQDTAQTTRIKPAAAITETMRASIIDANLAAGTRIEQGRTCGGAPCETQSTGVKLDCDTLLADANRAVDSGIIAMAFPVLDAKGIGDGIVSVRLVPVGQPLENTPTPTLTPLHSPTPTQAEAPACAGDCDGNGEVAVNELIQGVNIAVGNATLDRCPVFDRNMNGTVTVDELVAGVRNALDGCAGI